MTNIYDQHDKAFAHMSAFIVVKARDTGLERVATIAFKFPQNGAGRLYAYVHWLGVEMVRGHANGYGYDKRSAASASAAGRMLLSKNSVADPAFIEALRNDDGRTWDTRLRDAGFVVWQAV